ncbi:DNA/RNA non-specific endonuclease [Psychrobacter pygoscelis]|uniref:DNA/RNA non-specific endonuclease n=1 Tax=Psychrobacter pygoscelis TaxID=2488563 RepID=UPI003BFA0EDB
MSVNLRSISFNSVLALGLVLRLGSRRTSDHRDGQALIALRWLYNWSMGLGLVLLSVSGHADFDACQDSFYAGTAPDYLNTKITKNTYPLCFDGFATMYSGVSRTPLWSAEYLTRRRLTQADTIPREDSFHEESRLPASVRAELKDYSNSGYDRGHIAPNADMANVSQQYDSFSLANIAPQSPRNNRYVWRNLESATRYLTKQYGEVYTVTGVAFTSKRLKKIGSGVLVPSHFYKAVYIPAIGQAGVYYAPNDESERIEIISVDELALRTGVDVMPAIAATAKSEAFELPMKAGKTTADMEQTESAQEQPWWLLLIMEIIYWLIDQLRQ